MPALGAVEHDRGARRRDLRRAARRRRGTAAAVTAAQRHSALKASRSLAKMPAVGRRRAGPPGAPRRAASASWRSSSSCSLVEPGRGLHVDVDDEVAAAGAAQVGDAQAAQGDRVAGLGARLIVELVGAVEGVQAERRAERGGGHRQLDRAVQVVAPALNVGVRVDRDLDVEVAGRAAAGADLALAGELDPGAGVDAGRDLEGQRAAGAHPAVAGALEARVGDDRRRSPGRSAHGPGGHDLAEEGALHLLDLAAPAADVAGARCRCRAGRRRRGRWGRPPRCRWSAPSRRRTTASREVDVEPDQGVLAARAGATAGRAGAGRRRPPKKASMMSLNEKPWPKPAAAAARRGRRPGRRTAACPGRRARRRPGETSLNCSSASGPGLTSGCSWRASLR